MGSRCAGPIRANVRKVMPITRSYSHILKNITLLSLYCGSRMKGLTDNLWPSYYNNKSPKYIGLPAIKPLMHMNFLSLSQSKNMADVCQTLNRLYYVKYRPSKKSFGFHGLPPLCWKETVRLARNQAKLELSNVFGPDLVPSQRVHPK